MKPIRGHVLIDAPLQTVFDFVADERNEPRYNPRMAWAKKTTSGPIGVGTHFQVGMGGKTRATPVNITYTTFSRPRALASVSHMQGMDVEGSLNFTAEGSRTRLSWTWTVRPHGFLALLSPAIRAIGTRQERKNWTALKEYLERSGSR